ncbi:MAG: hypothetical protein KJ737_07590 [Proteobacteria bacterium]|nr:hypothetical protein [Pseudomonadota bacterium]
MSDFLKNLKMNKDRTNDSRHHQSSYRDNYHNNYDRRTDADRRSTYHRKSNYENPMTSMSKMLPDIQKLLSAIADNQKSQTDIYDRITTAEENVNRCLSQISMALNIIAAKMAPESADRLLKGEEPVPSFSDNTGEPNPAEFTKHDKDNVIDIIVHMRDNGATFEMIAQHLDNENIATFSNRGKWHAQTIHRLYKQNKKNDGLTDNNDQTDMINEEDEDELGPSY